MLGDVGSIADAVAVLVPAMMIVLVVDVFLGAIGVGVGLATFVAILVAVTVHVASIPDFLLQLFPSLAAAHPNGVVDGADTTTECLLVFQPAETASAATRIQTSCFISLFLDQPPCAAQSNSTVLHVASRSLYAGCHLNEQKWHQQGGSMTPNFANAARIWRSRGGN